MKSEHTLRLVSGLVYSVVMLGSAWVAPWTFAVVLVLTFAFAVREIALLFRSNVAGMFTGVALLMLPIFALYILRVNGFPEVFWLVFLGAMIFDTSSFYGGRLLGGAKLAPTISPKKTWSGAISGVLAIMVMILIFRVTVTPEFVGFGSDILTVALGYLLLASTLACAFLAGDLLISKLKRIHNVKDTGSIIPGHGGILDRIDSLLVAPIVPGLLLLVF